MGRNRRKYDRRSRNRGIHSEKGVFSIVCSILSLLILSAAVIYSVHHRGNADVYAGSVGLVGVVFSLMGFGGGITGLLEEGTDRIFCIIGLSINLLLILVMAGLIISSI